MWHTKFHWTNQFCPRELSIAPFFPVLPPFYDEPHSASLTIRCTLSFPPTASPFLSYVFGETSFFHRHFIPFPPSLPSLCNPPSHSVVQNGWLSLFCRPPPRFDAIPYAVLLLSWISFSYCVGFPPVFFHTPSTPIYLPSFSHPRGKTSYAWESYTSVFGITPLTPLFIYTVLFLTPHISAPYPITI